MKNIIKNIGLSLLAGASIASCTSIVDDVNKEDPNKLAKVSERNLLQGVVIADIAFHSGLNSMVSAIYTGQAKGLDRPFDIYQDYGFDVSDMTSNWNTVYQGVIKNTREIVKLKESDNATQLDGIARILEAHTITSLSSLVGDVPYSEAVDKGKVHPKFDKQADVYAAAQKLLDEAIKNLTDESGGTFVEDEFFAGNAAKWIATANTLKARLYLQTKEYTKALEASKKGINSAEGTMTHTPDPKGAGTDDSMWGVTLNNSTARSAIQVGDFFKSFVYTKRNNAKTDEATRKSHIGSSSISRSSGGKGFGYAGTPYDLISFQENLLNWAEAALRAGDFATALEKLNIHRANLENKVYFPVNSGKYNAYVEADFENGGIENTDNIAKNDALMREIIEERYATFFGHILAFTDARRYRHDGTAANLQVKITPNTGTKLPERYLYSGREVDNNPNAPKINDVFLPTPLNTK